MERTITCVVCRSDYTYDYKGGRLRRKCDSLDCDRQRDTAIKQRERDNKKTRPDGYTPADYPYGFPGTPQDVVAPLVEDTTARYWNQQLSDRSGPQYDEFSDDQWDDHIGVEQALLASGHAYQMDDDRMRDENPLRYIPAAKRDEVRDWFAKNNFPMAGMAGLSRFPGDYAEKILGSID